MLFSRSGPLLTHEDSRTFAILVVPCIYRIHLKSSLSSPRSVLEGSSALTSEPVKTLTAEISSLTLPSSSSSVSVPYTGGGASDSLSKEVTLGLSILGLSLNFGPLILLWPKTTIFSPVTLLSRPRFGYCISSPSPFSCSVWFHGLFRRNLCSCSEVINSIWRCAYSLQILLLNCLRTTTIDVITFFKSRIMAYLLETIQEANSTEEDWKQVDSKKILAQPHQSTTSNPSPKPICINMIGIIGDILSIAKSSFHDFSIRFIPRSENMFDDLATAVWSMTLGHNTLYFCFF